MAPRKKQEEAVEIMELKTGTFRVRIIGDTPLIYNCMAEKARRDLILPPDQKEKKRRKATGILKHNPIQEFRGSVYRFREDDNPTRLLFPAGGMKAAIAQAAIDIPGAAKAQIGRLCHIVESDIPIWGIPSLLMSVVRCAGINAAPDIRTRAILTEWCTEFSVQFIRPNLTDKDVLNLIAGAGLIVGIGDFRPQKGKGNFGTFHLAGTGKEEDATFNRIQKSGGRDAQDAALEKPTFYDAETEELMEWFVAECKRRELKLA